MNENLEKIRQAVFSPRGRMMLAAVTGVFACLLLLRGFACQKKPEIKPVKTDYTNILALLPLTGSGADQGNWCKRGIELAEIEMAPQDREQIILDYDDSRGDPRNALEAFQAWTSRKQITAILSWGSSVGMVLSPLVNEKGIVQMGVATAISSYRSVGDYTFRVFHSAEKEGKFIAEQLNKRLKPGYDRVALLRINNDYGESIAEGFRQVFEGSGRKTIFEEVFDPRMPDYRAQVTRLRTARAQFLVLITYPAEGALILRNILTAGIAPETYAAGALYSGKNFFDLAGVAAQDVRLVLPKPSEGERAKHFAEIYRERYQENLGVTSHYAARSYDAFNIVIDCLRKCQPQTAACLKDQLYQVQNYQGASGIISFDEAGDIDYPLALFQVDHGRFVMLDESGQPAAGEVRSETPENRLGDSTAFTQ